MLEFCGKVAKYIFKGLRRVGARKEKLYSKEREEELWESREELWKSKKAWRRNM